VRAGLLFKKRFFVTIASIFVLDIVTKQYALRALIEGASYEFLPFIDLYLTFNSGVAFGFLDIGNRVISNILTLIGILIVIYVFKLIKNETDNLKQYSLSLILGGAIGNIIDRFTDGLVTDFLHLKIADFSFFIFNIADASISLGAIFLIYLELFKMNHLSNEQTN
jgi:signal peptidase II